MIFCISDPEPSAALAGGALAIEVLKDAADLDVVLGGGVEGSGASGSDCKSNSKVSDSTEEFCSPWFVFNGCLGLPSTKMALLDVRGSIGSVDCPESELPWRVPVMASSWPPPYDS